MAISKIKREAVYRKYNGHCDSNWVHCIVSVIWIYGSNFADGDAGTHMFSAPALFDADQ